MIPTEPDPNAPPPGVIPMPASPWARVGRWTRDQCVRLRWELGPTYAAAAFGTGVEINAAINPGTDTAIVFGVLSGLSGAATLPLIDRDRSALFAAVAGFLGFGWASWQSAAGPSPEGLISLAGLTGLLSIRYGTWLREQRRHVEDQRHELQLAKVRHTPHAHAEIPGQRGAPELEAAPEREPLASVVWPGPADNPTITKPFALSPATEVLLPGGHILIVGETQSGKSSIEHVIVCNAIACPDAQVIGIDMKPGRLELGAYRTAGARVAQSVGEATELLEWVIAEGERRGEVLGVSFEETGEIHNQWTPTPEDPHLVVVLDEVAELVRQAPKLARKLETIASVLTALGITLVVCTQTPSASVWGGRTDTRAQFDTRIALRTAEQGHTRIGLGDDAIRAGFLAHDLQEQGEFYIRSRQHRRPDVDRSYWISNKVRADHIRAHARSAPAVFVDAEPDAFEAPERSDSMTTDILTYLQGRTAKPVEVAEAIGRADKADSVRAMMSRLSKAGLLERRGQHTYTATRRASNVVEFRPAKHP